MTSGSHLLLLRPDSGNFGRNFTLTPPPPYFSHRRRSLRRNPKITPATSSPRPPLHFAYFLAGIRRRKRENRRRPPYFASPPAISPAKSQPTPYDTLTSLSPSIPTPSPADPPANSPETTPIATIFLSFSANSSDKPPQIHRRILPHHLLYLSRPSPDQNHRRVCRNPKTNVFPVTFSVILPKSLSPNPMEKE